MYIKQLNSLKIALFAAAAAVCLAACGGQAAAPAAPVESVAEVTKVPANIANKGKEVFVKSGCIACHAIQGVAEGAVGPELNNLWNDAKAALASPEYKASKGKATTPDGYIRESIVDPNTYVSQRCTSGKCPEGVMLQNFKDSISASDLDALVGYLSTLGR